MNQAPEFSTTETKPVLTFEKVGIRVRAPRQVLAKEIGLRWVRIVETDLFAIKNAQELSSQVSKTYDLDLLVASDEVEVWMVDRAF